MRVPSIHLAAIALTAAVSLGGCAYGDPYGGLSVGVGYGSGYGGYGAYGYDPYYSGYSPYGYYGSRYNYGSYAPYYGWYDNFYYPGTGYYVYDSYRRPYRWTDRQRTYWLQRQQAYRSSGTTSQQISNNWTEFRRDRARANQSGAAVRRSTRQQPSVQPIERRHYQVERRQEQSQVRQERQESRETRRESREQSHRDRPRKKD